MKVIVDNIATNYLDEGEGKIVLILHGWWRDHKDFREVSNILKQNYRVISLDLPGFGDTEIPHTAVWSLDNYTDFVRKFIEKLNLNIFALVGHSFGGRIALKDQFNSEKIIFISAAGIKPKAWRKDVFMILAKVGDILSHIPPILFVRKKLKHKFYKIIGSDYLESGNMQKVFANVVKEDLSNFAIRIEKDTLIIWGEKDITTPLEDGMLIKRLIKNSRIEILPNTGHFSMIDEPEQISQLILDFLK